MGVVATTGFKTEPGRLADHLAASEEAIGHLRRLGLAAVALQPLAGTDVGGLVTIVNYADNAAYVKGMETILGDEKWQEFWARASSGGSATQYESTLFSDLDPSFQPDPDRPLAVLTVTQWRAKPGRLADFATNVMESIPHIERLGGTVRSMQSLIGAYPLTAMVSVSFGSLESYGAYSDALATDQGFQDYWAGVMSDPTADIVRSGLYVNISD